MSRDSRCEISEKRTTGLPVESSKKYRLKLNDRTDTHAALLGELDITSYVIGVILFMYTPSHLHVLGLRVTSYEYKTYYILRTIPVIKDIRNLCRKTIFLTRNLCRKTIFLTSKLRQKPRIANYRLVQSGLNL